MRILKITLITFAVLVFIVITGAVIFVKTFDINRFKPQILNQAGKALNRRVDFEKASLGISLLHGLNLKISNLVIADDPAFQKGNFLTVKNISLAVDPLKYVFKKEVNVPGVFIDSPHLTIIRQKEASLNVQTLAQPTQGAASESLNPVSVPVQQALPAILISSVKSGNGVITFIDRTFDPPLRLEISELSFSLSNISLAKPFPFVIEAAILSAKKNIKLEGKVQVDLKEKQVNISQLRGVSELSDISLEKIPLVSLKGKVELSISNLTAGAKGLTVFAGDVFLSNGFLQFKEMASPIKDAKMHLNFTSNKIIMDKTSLFIGQGVINATGIIDDYLVGQEYSLEADAKNLAIQGLIVQDKSPVKVEGLASGKMKLKGQGFSPQALKSTLSGEGDVSVTQAKLRNINVLRTVLDKISVIPVLAQKVEGGLPERFKQKLEDKDTALSDIKLPVILSNGQLVVNNAVIGADEFIFDGSGEVGFDTAYTVEGSFLIPQELSASMVAQVPELQYLLNTDNQIYIPLKISGRAGQPNFIVDSGYITKQLLINQAKQQLLKALDKAVGSKEQSTNATGQNAPGTQQGTTEDLIRGVLGDILKK